MDRNCAVALEHLARVGNADLLQLSEVLLFVHHRLQGQSPSICQSQALYVAVDRCQFPVEFSDLRLKLVARF